MFLIEFSRSEVNPSSLSNENKYHYPGPFLDQNHGLTPLEKRQFFDFLNSCSYSLERQLFVLEYRNRHFPGLYCRRKKVGKMAIFGPILWVNPFGKTSIFRLFQLPVFIAYKGIFSFKNIVKDIFLAYMA